MKTNGYEKEMERAAALEAAGEYADAAQVRAWAEQDREAMPRTVHDLTPGDVFTVPEKVNEYDQQAEHFLTSNGVKFRATLSDTKAPAWSDGGKHGHHYRVMLSKPAKRLVFDFWSSIADAEKGIKTVTPYDVLACISGDAYTPETFADFCGEFGYETDSIKALQTFRRCNAFAKRLRAFFTAAELEQLQEIN